MSASPTRSRRGPPETTPTPHGRGSTWPQTRRKASDEMSETTPEGLARLREVATHPECDYTVTDADGREEPCDRPVTGWRWYQDVEHEDMLDAACDWHENAGGNLMVALIDALEAERAKVAEIEAERDYHRARVDVLRSKLGGTVSLRGRKPDEGGVWAWVPRERIAALLDLHGGAVAWEAVES